MHHPDLSATRTDMDGSNLHIGIASGPWRVLLDKDQSFLAVNLDGNWWCCGLGIGKTGADDKRASD